MAGYRLYLIKDGHFVRHHEFDTTTDAEAISQADQLRANMPAELWRGRLKVRSFDQDDSGHDPADVGASGSSSPEADHI